MFLKTMKGDLISNAIVKHYDLKIEEQDIIEFAKTATRRQFALYGLRNIPDENLASHAMNMLKDEKSVRGIASQAIERKIAQIVSEQADVTIQELSLEEFNEMMKQERIKAEEFAQSEEVEILEDNANVAEVEETEDV